MSENLPNLELMIASGANLKQAWDDSTMIVALKRIAQLEAENAALKREVDATNAALEINDMLIGGVEYNLERTEIELAALKQALSEYADRENWVSATGPMGGGLSGWCGKGKGWEIADLLLTAEETC